MVMMAKKQTKKGEKKNKKGGRKIPGKDMSGPRLGERALKAPAFTKLARDLWRVRPLFRAEGEAETVGVSVIVLKRALLEMLRSTFKQCATRGNPPLC